jgi:hypothetical protein
LYHLPRHSLYVSWIPEISHLVLWLITFLCYFSATTSKHARILGTWNFLLHSHCFHWHGTNSVTRSRGSSV